MTVTEALAVLGKAGRIQSPWLPGMRVTDVNGQPCRLIAQHPNSDWVVVPGFALTFIPVRLAFLATAAADLTDPATVGCLLALFREAEGDPSWYATRDRSSSRWVCEIASGYGDHYFGATEGEAIATAIVALAGAQ